MNQNKEEVVDKYGFFRDSAREAFRIYRDYDDYDALKKACMWQLGWSHILRMNMIRNFDCRKKPRISRWTNTGRK